MPPSSELPAGYDPEKDPIEIVNYDPAWTGSYLSEEKVLREALAGFPGLQIEHFGSTSVPGLSAKPVIDIMVAVESRSLWPRLVAPIQGLGYAYWNANPDKQQMFFVKGMPPFGDKRTHHVHVYEFLGRRWTRELAFRDHLRIHRQTARDYETLKRGLAAKFTFDREAYVEGKTAFIEKTLEKILK